MQSILHKAVSRVCQATRVVALLAAWSVLAACAADPPEQRLREAMGGVQSAIEQRDAAALSTHLAEDFIGPDGMDRDGARRMARVLLRRYRNVGVTLGPPDIELRDGHAAVRFNAVMTGGSGVVPQSARVQEVVTGWREEGDRWRLTSARWERRL